MTPRPPTAPRTRRAALLLGSLMVAAALPGAARGEVEYETAFQGVDDATEADLRQASQLVALEDKHPATLAALRRRADGDLARLREVMAAEGFYDARISAGIDAKQHPAAVTVTVAPGGLYHLAGVELLLADGTPAPPLAEAAPAALGLAPDQPARSAPVVAAEAKIAHVYAQHGWPFAKVAHRRVVIDVATKTMRVAYTLDPGARARFGVAAVEGLAWLDPAYVRRRITWREGEPYDQGQVDATRQALVASGLFGEVTVEPAGPVAADGSVAMRLRLVERPLHTAGVGAAYDTNLGLEGNLSWEDRDLFGAAEDLSWNARGGRSDSGLTLKFRRPDMLWYRQDLVTNVSLDNELVEAFRGLHEEIDVGFEQHFTPQLTGSYEIEAEHARINEKIDTRVYTLVGLPLTLKQDGTDDLMNPTTGYRAALQLTPYLTALGSELTYVQGQLTGSTYQKLDAAGAYILALQGTAGASCCAPLGAIPKDHRFYAGGGGSVRGFGFEKAGPWDTYDNPIGGRSLLVGTVELRTRLTREIGLVPFLDAGTDGASPLPKFDSKYYCGAGIGLRYFTAIGPLRLDLATPLDPHSRGDSPIQIYVSIGQSF